MGQVVDFDDVVVREVGLDEVARRLEVEHLGHVVMRNVEIEQKGHVGEGRQVGDVVVGQVEDLELVVLGEQRHVDEGFGRQMAVDEARGTAVGRSS